MSVQIKKYIIAENFTIIFDPVIKHDDLTKNLPFNITGAGYVTIEPTASKKDFSVRCWKKCDDSELKFNPVKDKKAIEKFLALDNI
jgi:hypothetical protein